MAVTLEGTPFVDSISQHLTIHNVCVVDQILIQKQRWQYQYFHKPAFRIHVKQIFTLDIFLCAPCRTPTCVQVLALVFFFYVWK